MPNKLLPTIYLEFLYEVNIWLIAGCDKEWRDAPFSANEFFVVVGILRVDISNERLKIEINGVAKGELLGD
jgi:hypothetical protein